MSIKTLSGATPARLRIPAKFHQINYLTTILYLAHALVFFLGPAVVAFAIVDNLPESPWLRCVIALTLGVIGGHGMHLLTFVGHEGMHTNLHRNKYLSAALAVLFTAMVPFFFIVGFAMTHWKHHRYTGQTIDPDVQIYSQYKGFWSRFFIARFRSVRAYTKNTILMVSGRVWPEDTKLPFTQKEMCWISRANVALGLCAVTAYGFIWYHSLWLGFTVMLVPYMSLYVMSSMRAYIEHTGTVPGRYVDSRSYTSPIYTALFFGSNFHLEHHQYPAVPCYLLPALHKHLQAQQAYAIDGVQIEPTFLGALRYTTGHFQYPCVDLQPVADDFIDRIADGQLDRSAEIAGAQAGKASIAVAHK